MPIAWDGPFCPYVHCADDSVRPRPWRLPHRRLAHYLMFTSMDGPEEDVIDGRTVVVPEGATCLIPPGALHDLSSRANRPVWVHFDLRWDPHRAQHPYAGDYEADLGRRRRFLQPSPQELFGMDLPLFAPDELTPLFHATMPRIVAAWQRGGRIGLLEARHLLAGLMLSWVGHALREQDAGDDQARVARAESVALRSLGAAFGVDEFAAASGWSRSRFCAVFARLRGASPGTWLRRERMRSAASLLARPDLTVAAVGALVGYPDPTVFGRVFRSHHGMTPGEWRERRTR
jgi:AraC-like DNA-binding protein